MLLFSFVVRVVVFDDSELKLFVIEFVFDMSGVLLVVSVLVFDVFCEMFDWMLFSLVVVCEFSVVLFVVVCVSCVVNFCIWVMSVVFVGLVVSVVVVVVSFEDNCDIFLV